MVADRALTPADAAVALRSFPRRFRSVFARPDDDDRVDPDEVARRAGTDGRTAVDHLSAAISVADAVREATRQRTPAPLPTAAPDDGRGLPQLLDELDAAAIAAADAVDAVSTDDWSIEGLLGLVQDAVGLVADHLRAAQRVISEVV